MVDLKKMAEEARERLKKTADIADRFRSDDRLHRLGMRAVFIMEDIAFDLLQMSEGKMPPKERKSSLKDPPD